MGTHDLHNISIALDRRHSGSGAGGGDWESSQTIAPTGLAVTGMSLALEQKSTDILKTKKRR